MTVETLTLTDFLLARIAEDESLAERSIQIRVDGAALISFGSPDAPPTLIVTPARMLAECEAKRRIVEAHPLTRDVVPVWTGTTPGVACQNCAALGRNEGDIVEDIGPCETLLALATVYADHPDYREEWRH